MKCTLIISSIMAAGSLASNAATLLLDFQPTSGTTAVGHQAFEHTNADPFPSINYNEFGTTITVAVSGANLDAGDNDRRSVTRNGAASDVLNDWIGVDARDNPVEATFTITVTGLPVGDYTWTSFHHDGGTISPSSSSNGNIRGNISTTFVDSTGTVNGSSVISSELIGDTPSFFTTTFTSDGSAVSLTLGSTGGGSDAIFAFANSLEITSIAAVPEPSSTALLGLGGLALILRRRR